MSKTFQNLKHLYDEYLIGEYLELIYEELIFWF